MTEKAKDHDGMPHVLADNAAYVRRGRNPVIRHDPGWDDEIRGPTPAGRATPFLYADGLIMLAAAPGTS